MTILFISDLHLDPDRPVVTRLFRSYLDDQTATLETLYILGDLFEAWIGDDDDSEPAGTVIDTLRDLTDRGVAVRFIHGNRDFLLGEKFATASGIELLPEATVIDLYSVPTLIMHGDTLCTDDTDYQAFRTQVRSPQWQQAMLARPLSERRLYARQLRAESQRAGQQKAESITDVNDDAVIEALQHYQVRQLIHGHTHRPAIHELTVGDEPARRIVLGDWYQQGSVLICTPDNGCRLEQLDLPQE